MIVRLEKQKKKKEREIFEYCFIRAELNQESQGFL